MLECFLIKLHIIVYFRSYNFYALTCLIAYLIDSFLAWIYPYFVNFVTARIQNDNMYAIWERELCRAKWSRTTFLAYMQ